MSAPHAQAGETPAQRRTFAVAVAVILLVIVVAFRLLHPFQPAAWSYQDLTLCLLVAAIAGRALLPFRGPEGERRDLVWPTPVLWLAIFLAAVLPYLQTLRVGFVSDDFGLAAAVREAAGPLDAMGSAAFRAFYRPLALLLWWLGDHLWHGAPVGYHAVALLLHGLNALLVYALGRRLIGSTYAALMAALLFAVHPLHVEPVTWIAAGSDLLCSTFSLLSLLSLEASLGATSRRSKAALTAGALGAFLLALLGKESAFPLPGVVALRLLLDSDPERRSKALPLTGLYALLLLLYLAWRSSVLGGIGGYSMPLTVWNTLFPSAPLLMIADFLFPVHRTLFAAHLTSWLWWLALLGLALAAFWWLLGLDRVPARRLWLWLGFVFLMAVPTWVFRWQPSASLEWTRFAYLPTIGLALMFGDLCAGRGLAWRRSAAVGVLILAAATALTICYVTPWREAGRLASRAVTSGLTMLDKLKTDDGPSTLYVSNLPQAWHGAPVFANCYPQALILATGAPVPVRVISDIPRSGGIHPDVMAVSRLKPGEHIVSWDPKSESLHLVRSGGGQP